MLHTSSLLVLPKICSCRLKNESLCATSEVTHTRKFCTPPPKKKKHTHTHQTTKKCKLYRYSPYTTTKTHPCFPELVQTIFGTALGLQIYMKWFTETLFIFCVCLTLSQCLDMSWLHVRRHTEHHFMTERAGL